VIERRRRHRRLLLSRQQRHELAGGGVLVSHHRLLSGGRPDGDDHRGGQRGKPDDRECDDGVADQQRASAERGPLALGLVKVLEILVSAELGTVLIHPERLALTGHRVGQLRLPGGRRGRGHERRLVPGQPGDRRQRGRPGIQTDRRSHCGRVPRRHNRGGGGGQRRSPGERERGVVRDLHPHRRCVAKLVGDRSEVRRGAQQE
jgi:hypothetical protein